MTGELNKEFSKLRFLDENGETYPEWEEKKVSDVFNISRGKVIAKSSVSQEQNELSKYPIYSSQTLNDGIMGYGKDYNFEGDSLTWTTDGAYAGKVRYRTGEYSCTNVCGVLQAKDDFSGMANKLMENIIGLKTPLHVVKVGNPKLMSNIMADIEISIPSLPEQEKIANFLSKIDEKIEAQSNLVELLKKQKQGYSQKIFNGSLRFKKDDGTDFDDWEEKKLGEVAKLYQPQTISGSDLTKTGYTVYGANGLIGYYSKYNHENEEVLITCRGNSVGTINFSLPKSWITGNAMVASPIKSSLSKPFLYHILRKTDFKTVIEGSGQPQITRNPLSKIEINLPSLPEQEKIAAFLSSLDNRIEQELNKLEKLKLEKNGYMQRMLG